VPEGFTFGHFCKRIAAASWPHLSSSSFKPRPLRASASAFAPSFSSLRPLTISTSTRHIFELHQDSPARHSAASYHFDIQQNDGDVLHAYTGGHNSSAMATRRDIGTNRIQRSLRRSRLESDVHFELSNLHSFQSLTTSPPLLSLTATRLFPTRSMLSFRHHFFVTLEIHCTLIS